MYINPFVAGILATILVEFTVILIYGFYKTRRK